MNLARIESDAQDRAQTILGALSLVIWFVVAFALGVRWFIDENTPQPILMAGGIALASSRIEQHAESCPSCPACAMGGVSMGGWSGQR